VTLDDPATFERTDPHDARRVLADFPEQCRDAVGLRPHPVPVRKAPRLVVVAGMGGSAAGGDLLAACSADRLDVPVLVHRGYGLPALAGKDSLVIASSYSGETAEVLSAVDVALARGLPVVVLTAGGKLAAVAASTGLPRVTLPGGIMPRMALGYLFFPILGILEMLGLSVASAAEVAEALDTLEALQRDLGPERVAADNEAKRLALAVGPRLPAIYGGPTTGPVAYRWKTDFEENVKAFALAGTLPEMNHNELEAWRAPGARGMHLVLLRDHEEPPEIARRFAVLRELIAPAADGISEAWPRGTGRLARLLSLTCLGQWMSYYVAVLRGVDPWSVPLLDELKRRLGSETLP
jgi:glucose/mannose-6-phosphate isomerase